MSQRLFLAECRREKCVQSMIRAHRSFQETLRENLSGSDSRIKRKWILKLTEFLHSGLWSTDSLFREFISRENNVSVDDRIIERNVAGRIWANVFHFSL